MAKYNFDISYNRRELDSAKWDIKENEIALSVADMDFLVMDEIREKVNELSKKGIFGYTRVTDRYFQSYVDWYQRRHNARFEIKDCIFSTSVVASLDVILQTLLKKGDKVGMFTPIYATFFNCIKNNGCEVLSIPFIYKDYKYEIDWESFECLAKEIKAFIFCNPHNPNGYRFSKEEILKIIEICRVNDVYLLSDEIHGDIDLNKEKYNSILAVDDSYPRLITLFSPGKIFNLAGLHSSIVVIKEKKLRELIQKELYRLDVGEPSFFSVEPIITAFEKGEQFVFEVNEAIALNRELVYQFFEKNLPSLHIVKGEMTYLIWIDISDTKLNSDQFSERLKEDVGVVVSNGKRFGDDRFIRINIATTKEILLESLNRIKKFVDSL